MSTRQASVGSSADWKLAQRTVKQVFLAMKTRRTSCRLPAALTFRHKFNSTANRRWRNRQIFQDLCTLWQKPVTVKNVAVSFLQIVIEKAVRFAEKTSIDVTRPIVVEWKVVWPGIASRLSFEMLRQQPRVVLHSSLWVGVNCCHCMVRRRALLFLKRSQRKLIKIPVKFPRILSNIPIASTKLFHPKEETKLNG